jgi:hypothetical protein
MPDIASSTRLDAFGAPAQNQLPPTLLPPSNNSEDHSGFALRNSLLDFSKQARNPQFLLFT